MSDLSYRMTLPINRFEVWLLRIAFAFGFFGIGWACAITYALAWNNPFEKGINWAYNHGVIQVEREKPIKLGVGK